MNKPRIFQIDSFRSRTRYHKYLDNSQSQNNYNNSYQNVDENVENGSAYGSAVKAKPINPFAVKKTATASNVEASPSNKRKAMVDNLQCMKGSPSPKKPLLAVSFENDFYRLAYYILSFIFMK